MQWPPASVTIPAAAILLAMPPLDSPPNRSLARAATAASIRGTVSSLVAVGSDG